MAAYDDVGYDDDWFAQQAPPGLAPGQEDPYAGGVPEAPGGQFPDPTPSRPPTGTGGGGGTPGFTGNPKADFLRLVAGLPPTPASIARVMPIFAQWYPGSSYEKGDIKGPWGWADVIGGLDDPSKSPKWQWYSGDNNPLTPPRGAGGAFGLGVNLPSGTLPSGNLTSLAAMALEKSPGFQFRLDEGRKALERSAAARGTLLTGGTLKGLERYAQDYASGEYANQYARLFGEAQERFRQQAAISGLGLQAQNQGFNQYLGLSDLGLRGQQQQYNQLLGASDVGLRGVSGANLTGSSYANLIADILRNRGTTGSELITGGANAAAAGTVNRPNPYQAVSGVPNDILQYILLSQVLNQPRAS